MVVNVFTLISVRRQGEVCQITKVLTGCAFPWPQAEILKPPAQLDLEM